MVEKVFLYFLGIYQKLRYLLKDIANVYFDGRVDGGFLLLCCLAIPAIILIRAIAFIGNGYYVAYAGISVVQSIQIEMYKKVQKLPLSFFNQYKTGEINAAVMSYPKQIKMAVVDTSNDLIIQPLTLISALTFYCINHTKMRVFMVIIGALSAPLYFSHKKNW